MRVYRFYLDLNKSSNELSASHLRTGDAAIIHQLTKVLRMTSDSQETITFFDGTGMDYECSIESIDKSQALFKLNNKIKNTRALDIDVRFFVPVIKMDRFEFMIQKLTELGVSSFIPVCFERSQKQNIEKLKNPNQRKRLERIIIEAIEQCEGASLPKLEEAIDFNQLAELIDQKDLNIYAYEKLAGSDNQDPENLLRSVSELRANGARLNLLVGPEGGISAEENKLLQSLGLLPIALGRRYLKAETAAVSLFAYLHCF